MPIDIKPDQVWKDRGGKAHVRVLSVTGDTVRYEWAEGAVNPGMRGARYRQNFRDAFELVPAKSDPQGLKRGDKVLYVDDYHPAHSHNVKKGDVREVAEVTHVGHIILTPVPGDTMHPRYTFGQGSFELVPEGPKWSDVEPGDKVTIRVRDTGEELTTTATHRSDAYGQAYNRASVLGLAPGLGLPSNRWELVSIEKPKPQPPTTPGSVVLVHSGSRAWPNGLPLLRQHTGRWVGQNGQSWSDHDVAYANGGTFTVIHDAGASS